MDGLGDPVLACYIDNRYAADKITTFETPEMVI